MYSYAQSFINFFSVTPPQQTRKPNLGPEYDNEHKQMYFWPPVRHPNEESSQLGTSSSTVEPPSFNLPKSLAEGPAKPFIADGPRFVPSSPTVTIVSATSSDETYHEQDTAPPLSPSRQTAAPAPMSSIVSSVPHSKPTDVPAGSSSHNAVGTESTHGNGLLTASSGAPTVRAHLFLASSLAFPDSYRYPSSPHRLRNLYLLQCLSRHLRHPIDVSLQSQDLSCPIQF